MARGPERGEPEEAIRYERLAECVDAAVFITEPSGRMLYANRALERLTGYSAADFQFAQSDNPFLHREDAERVGRFIAAFIQSDTEISEPIENRFCDRWGQVRWFRSTLARIRYDGRDAIQFVTRPLDPPAAHAHDLRRDYEILVENAGEGIAKLDVRGRFLFTNERFQTLVGREAVALGHGVVADLIHPSRHDDAALFVRPGTFETKLLRADGETREVDVVVTALAPESEHELMALVRDVTEKRAAERELRRRERLHDLGLLAGSLAHDLNGLLAAILNARSVAERTLGEGSPAAPLLREIGDAAQKAALRCDEVMAGPGREATKQPLDLGDVVDRALRTVRASVEDAEIALTVHREPGVVVVGDAAGLEAIVVNLMTNAVEALAGARGERRITLDLRRLSRDGGSSVELRVADTGVGMDEETRERLFDPFFTTKPSGHGLGMPSVLARVQGHGGQIAVDSSPGAGTTVRVTLPAFVVGALAPDGPSGGGARFVIVADDEPTFRRSVRLILEDSGLSTREVASGSEALELVRTDGNNVLGVVIDSRLPGVRGEVAAATMRELRPELPVVLVSGDPRAAPPIAGVRFLAKPFDPAVLLELLRPEIRRP
jgi:PAS domain S-box-containing protein